jgi:tetratricopeptide (TPR) repeat protein
MNETKQFESLSALAEANDQLERAQRRSSIASVRVSPGPYLGFASVLTFVSALVLRSGFNATALVLLVVAWAVVPILALTDRTAFDGHSIRRQGPLSFLLRILLDYKKQISVEDFETVETNAVRTLRRGGSVRYRYRTQITGKGKEFVISSGGKEYRKLVRALFPLIHEDKLDNRSRDLRDYLNEPRSLNRKTRLSQLASPNILDVTREDFRLGGKLSKRPEGEMPASSAADIERAHLLRRLGNELRVSGRLREAGEAFRRALNVSPRGPWLIYDFARLLRSQASAQADARLLSRARAALRLALIRAENDLVLLPLIGESFLECGDARQARLTLQKAIELDGGNYKARLGMADLALREGKLAHVIHHFREAARVSHEQSLVRYARREADYYLLLNNDEEYLATELRRINWLQSITRVRKLATRVTNSGILLALAGGYLDPVAGSVGWSLASSSLIVWLLTVVGSRVLFSRSKPPSIA